MRNGRPTSVTLGLFLNFSLRCLLFYRGRPSVDHSNHPPASVYMQKETKGKKGLKPLSPESQPGQGVGDDRGRVCMHKQV